ncbi:MAG: DEAD/DEAH box helicase [Phycisphaerales bacterium]|nr:DEAD/DEAH box helicase [Phycisphaerales bacterium]
MSHASPESGSHSAFALLATEVQRQLYRMKWTSLRPIQVDAIRAYLQTDSNLLITADTAGGKTEAAFLPVLSSISVEPTGSIRALYVGPLKALINDQFSRLEELCTYLEMPVYRWHGDVPVSQKKALVREPGGVLLITPESLESILINRTSALHRLFAGLRALVIDEVHAFLENERGLHLASLISRVRRYRAPQEPPFRVIGLSATVGDVSIAKHYLAPGAADEVKVISDDSAGKEIQFRLHGYFKQSEAFESPDSDAGDAEAEEANPDMVPDTAQDLAQLEAMSTIADDLVEHCRMHSNLIFANAKGDIEIYADLANEKCRKSGLPETFLVHHGSLSKELREDTEEIMKSGRPMTTICSSTLEMGIDIGSVRLIGQIGAPWSVASLKQRMGRSGRKDNEPRRLRVYVISDSASQERDPVSQLPLDLLQATAACELMLQKWIEPPRPARLDLSTLTHQIISTIAEVGAIEAGPLFERLCRDGPFTGFSTAMFARLLRQLAGQDVLEQGPDGKLILGLVGEQIRTRYDFYAAFATSAEFSIVDGSRVLGSLPLDTLPKVGENIVFAARRWQVVDIDAGRLVLYVKPARRRKRPRFTGTGGDIHAKIREEMRLLLLSPADPVYLDSIALESLHAARAAAAEHDLARRHVLPLGRHRSLWLTWAGTTTQRTLLALLASMGIEATDREIAIECRLPDESLRMRLRASVEIDLNPLRLAHHVVPKQFRKFDHLFDDLLLDESIALDRLDCASALHILRETAAMPAEVERNESVE